MPFLSKQACSRPRNDGNGYHGYHYNVLYDPDAHAEIFDNQLSTCEWLVGMMCSKDILYRVTFFDGDFFIQHLGLRCSVSISKDYVASAAFHPLDVELLISQHFDSNPVWFESSDNHILGVLLEQGHAQLIDALGLPKKTNSTLRHLAQSALKSLQDNIQFVLNSDSVSLRNVAGEHSDVVSRQVVIFSCFVKWWGEDLARKLMVPEFHSSNETPKKAPVDVGLLQLVLQRANLYRFSKKDLKGVLAKVPHQWRQMYSGTSHSSIVNALIGSFALHCDQLCDLTSDVLMELVLCCDPFYFACPLKDRLSIVLTLLQLEFSSDIVTALTCHPGHVEGQDSQGYFQSRLDGRKSKFAKLADIVKHIKVNWPVIPDQSTMLDCMRAYCVATSISVPLTCACCDRSRLDVPMSVIKPLTETPT
jgi:hypothetical protein